MSNISEKIKEFYKDENNKATKIALIAICGSLLAYTAYYYTKNNQSEPKIKDSYQQRNLLDEKENEAQDDTMNAPDIDYQETKQQEADRMKKIKEEKDTEIERIISKLLNEGLIVDGKGYNIEYFMQYYTKKDSLHKYTCNSCKNICRDCVEVDNDGDNKDTEDAIVFCEACAKLENQKYTAYKTMRKIINKMNIFLPDPDDPDAMKNFKSIYTGTLSKCIKTKIPQMAEQEYNNKQAETVRQNIIQLETGKITPLNWKFHDESKTKEALFLISDDGLMAKSNKRSGTILFGPLICTKKWVGKGKWDEDYNFAGNYYEIELKITEADGCGIGFCQKTFNQFIGKNEAGVSCMMLNQTGWFYTSRTFKSPIGYQHSRESPMGKWFKSNDIIVMIIDCTDSDNVKGKIYNKNKQDKKFEIEKLPKNICIGVNIIVGSNPTGSVQPQVSIVSQTVERRLK